jgi:hypothetical protein
MLKIAMTEEYKYLKYRIKYLEKTSEELTKEVSDLRNLLNNPQINDDVSFDFKAIKCVSIEYLSPDTKNPIPRTIITALINNNTFDFTFYVSKDKHKELVRQFELNKLNK